MPQPLDDVFLPWTTGSNAFRSSPLLVNLPLVSFAVYALDGNDVQWIEENMGGTAELGASTRASVSTAQDKGVSSSESLGCKGSPSVIELVRDNSLHADFHRRLGDFCVPVECFSMHGNMNRSFAHKADCCSIYDSELDLFYRIVPDPLEASRNAPTSSGNRHYETIGRDKADRISVLAKKSQPSARIAVLRIMREIASAHMCLSNWLPLHAAAVAHDQQAILILGERRAGKTTLSLQLLSHLACSFISNDRVFVDASATPAPVVHGIPGVINVRHGSISLLQESMELSAMSSAQDPLAPGPQSVEQYSAELWSNELWSNELWSNELWFKGHWSVGKWRARQTLDEALQNSPCDPSDAPVDLSLSTRQFLHLTGSSSTRHASLRLALFPQIIESDGSPKTGSGFQVQRLSYNETCERLQENIFPIKPTVFTQNYSWPTTHAQGIESLANSLVALDVKVPAGKLIAPLELKHILADVH